MQRWRNPFRGWSHFVRRDDDDSEGLFGVVMGMDVDQLSYNMGPVIIVDDGASTDAWAVVIFS